MRFFFSFSFYINRTCRYRNIFYQSFCNISEEPKTYQYKLFAFKYVQVTETLAESKFLFSEDIWKGVCKIIESIQKLVPTGEKGMSKEEFDKAKQDYLDAVKSCELKLILKKMEQELNLTEY